MRHNNEIDNLLRDNNAYVASKIKEEKKNLKRRLYNDTIREGIPNIS